VHGFVTGGPWLVARDPLARHKPGVESIPISWKFLLRERGQRCILMGLHLRLLEVTENCRFVRLFREFSA
jgi:hypothetical protein